MTPRSITTFVAATAFALLTTGAALADYRGLDQRGPTTAQRSASSMTRTEAVPGRGRFWMARPVARASDPALIPASIDMVCGHRTYTVSTGAGKGDCANSGGSRSFCSDGRNAAQADCASGCVSSKGSGSCSVRSAD